ncbi:hypothetical protein MHBO_004212, partial [Bonamia ostreae]
MSSLLKTRKFIKTKKSGFRLKPNIMSYRFASTTEPKYNYQKYETSEGDGDVQIRRWRTKDPEVMDKILSYKSSIDSDVKGILEKYPSNEVVSNKPIFNQWFFLPRPIHTFGRSGKRTWGAPIFAE